jgi:serine/threonine protein kinase
MAIHEYRSTLAHPPGEGDINPRQGGLLGNLNRFSTDMKDHTYGFHGNIKPENVLWSEEDIEDEDGNYAEQGLLLIADYGLMNFHGTRINSIVDPESISASPSYEPPERSLRVKISRAYDIWSLGCVYLEFITWLVAGWAKLDNFPEVRGKTSPLSGINDDKFFTILENRSSSSTQAIIRETVTEWIKDLHETARCSQFIHDFLDLISRDMLVVDPNKRIHCGPLYERLEEMLKEAREDPRYLTEPKPIPERVRSDVARRMSHTGRQKAGKDHDSPPPSPTEGLALAKRNVPHNLDSVAGSPPSRPMSPMHSFSQFE